MKPNLYVPLKRLKITINQGKKSQSNMLRSLDIFQIWSHDHESVTDDGNLKHEITLNNVKMTRLYIRDTFSLSTT